MSDKYFAYVGVKPCGCKVAATVISPQWAKETAKTVAAWIAQGWTVEQVECSEASPVPIARCQCEGRNEVVSGVNTPLQPRLI